MKYRFFVRLIQNNYFCNPFPKELIISNLNVILIKTDDEKLFSTSC